MTCQRIVYWPLYKNNKERDEFFKIKFVLKLEATTYEASGEHLVSVPEILAIAKDRC